jgi:aspartyl-tRNA synthetase
MAEAEAEAEAGEQYGDLQRVQSRKRTGRRWEALHDLHKERVGEEVLVRARVHVVRGKGKSCFLQLRRSMSTLQAVLFANQETVPKAMVTYASKIPRESVVDVSGNVVDPGKPIESCTQQVELHVSSIHCISRSAQMLPLQVDDASQPDSELEKHNTPYVPVSMDTRLDNRIIDLRTPANQAIFRLQSKICELFRRALLNMSFTEIHSPKLIKGASEGGSAVFKTEYMGSPACLAQSPQLYKQMAVEADLERVFEIGPVFRAENSNTHRHLCEFTGLDMEMAIYEHYTEVLDVLDTLFTTIFTGLNKECAEELRVISQQYPFEPLQFDERGALKMTYQEGIELLQKHGYDVSPYEDIGSEEERALGKIVKKERGTEFYALTRYPAAARPFYTMPDPEDDRYTNGFDVFVRGEEITSGSQRIHDAELLKERAEVYGVDTTSIMPYIQSFTYGALPHGGAGIGLERVMMLFLDLGNVKRVSLFPRTPNRISP